MRFLKGFRPMAVLGAMVLGCGLASASAGNIYIAQNAAGAANGSSCANAYAVTFFNTSSNWGAGASQIGPGTTLHLCGTITTELQVQASGTSGSVIEVLWEPGARISLAVGNTISLNGHSYLLFDGGSPCGPNTTCSTTDSGTGTIENTANGSALPNHIAYVYAFDGTGSSANVEVRNLVIRNLYVHSSLTDTTNSADTNTGLFYANPFGTGWSIHDSTEHDMGTCFQLQGFVANSTISIYNNYCYNMDWGVGLAGSGSRTALIHDNHFGSTTNWDTTADAFHHDGLHLYMATSATSIATEVYNNLFDGVWGTCCTTAFIYQENSTPNNFDLFNNVFNQHPGDSYGNGLVTASSENGEWSGNTFQCAGNGYAIYPLVNPTGTVNIRNNSFSGCNTFIRFYGSSGTPGVVDYNAYMSQGSGGGNPPWLYSSGSSANTLSAWQSQCGCDAHSFYSATDYLNVDGTASSGFPGLRTGSNPGTNLSSLTYTALGSSTSAGDTITVVARPTSGSWDIGAYQYSGGSGAPVPPANVTAISH